jgi:hypothetical protein
LQHQMIWKQWRMTYKEWNLKCNRCSIKRSTELSLYTRSQFINSIMTLNRMNTLCPESRNSISCAKTYVHSTHPLNHPKITSSKKIEYINTFCTLPYPKNIDIVLLQETSHGKPNQKLDKNSCTI